MYLLLKTKPFLALSDKENKSAYFFVLFLCVSRNEGSFGAIPVQYLENIGPLIERFDWLILVIGPLTA